MALAKFLEDNQERLYASLEESRRQVDAIDEDSTKEDWQFIKNRLATELNLVQDQFNTVLKIVTNPEFEKYVQDYEKKQSLERQLSYTYSQIDQLLSDKKKLDNELIQIKEKNKQLRRLVNKQFMKMEQSKHQICELSESILDIKLKLANAKNDLNHYKTVFYNRTIDYEKMHSELVQTKERLRNIERSLQPDTVRSQVLDEKITLISRLTQSLMQLDEWCGMLEQELGITGERPIDIVIDSIPTSSKSRPIKFTSYKELALELANTSIELAEKDRLLSEKDTLIAAKEKENNELKRIAERNQRYQASLEKELIELEKQIESSRKAQNNDDGHKVIRRIKKSDVDKIYNKNKKATHRRVNRPYKKSKKNNPLNPGKVQSWSADKNRSSKSNKSKRKGS